MKIHPVRTGLFMRTDRQTDRRKVGRKEGRTDMTKLTVAFYNFADVSINC